jgi:YidC/Oxa1 family membrane protein insertase
MPAHMNMIFLGILNISKKSLILAILAGLSQYLQAKFMPAPVLSSSSSKGESFQESFSKSMNMQMKYVFPFLVAFIAYSISGAVALYWITSNLFMVGQQIYIKKKEFASVVVIK